MRKIILILVGIVFLTACSTTTGPVAGPENNTYIDHVQSGGVPKDGIPSIDNPRFVEPNAVDSLADDAVVFGVERNGTAKAYPQRILVHHEIVNDEINGDNISVTYCPLTGTAIGFERGNTELGVSGKLLNSNLVIYDRATDSYFPQILGEGIKGPRDGERLDSFRVVWTTWKDWRTQHPNTTVLSEDTGHLRNYDNDPYGGYAPRNGYYQNQNVLFPTMRDDDRLQPKTVVYAYEHRNNSFAVTPSNLREQRVITIDADNTTLTMVHDPSLQTARLYDTGKATIQRAQDRYTYNNTVYEADNLPFKELSVFDAFWFSWAAFHPDTALYD